MTSCVRGEGRSTIAAALASIEASVYARKTALVELDFARRDAAVAFGLNNSPGVCEFVRDGHPIDEYVQWSHDKLGIVVAGTDVGCMPELSAPLVAPLVKDMMETVETVVLDLPPLNPGEGALPVLDLCDAVVLVVRAGSVSRGQIAAASEAIGRPAYAILNDHTSASPGWLRRLCGIGG